MRLPRIASAFLFALTLAHAETALLECTANARSGDYFLVQFRVSAIRGWSIEKSLVLLHANGKVPLGKVRVGLIGQPWKEAPESVPKPADSAEIDEQARPDGWISLAIPPEMVQQLADRKVFGLAIWKSKGSPPRYDLKETIQYSPYLAVQGTTALP